MRTTNVPMRSMLPLEVSIIRKISRQTKDVYPEERLPWVISSTIDSYSHAPAHSQGRKNGHLDRPWCRHDEGRRDRELSRCRLLSNCASAMGPAEQGRGGIR